MTDKLLRKVDTNEGKIQQRGEGGIELIYLHVVF